MVHLQAVRQPGSLIEGVERQFLNKGESVYQDVVAFRSELYYLQFLATHDRSHIGFTDTHYPVFHTFTRFIPVEMVLLLAIHPCDDSHITLLPDCQQIFHFYILPLHLAYFRQYLSQKVKQAPGYLPGLDIRMPALLPVCKICLFYIQILRSRSMQVHLFTQHAHDSIRLLYPLPQQLRIRRVAHLTLVAGCIRVHHIRLLQVWLPGTRQNTLLLLELQLVRQFCHNIIQQLIVCQGM